MEKVNVNIKQNIEYLLKNIRQNVDDKPNLTKII
jgi:hypothetical protein